MTHEHDPEPPFPVFVYGASNSTGNEPHNADARAAWAKWKEWKERQPAALHPANSTTPENK